VRNTPAGIATAVALAALALTGCASGATSPGSGSATSSASGAPATRIEVTVSHGRISPKPSLHHIHLGDRVQLTVTSDQPDEVHLHGYDQEIAIQPGKPGTINVTADLPGIFEVELHKSDLQLLQLEVK